MIVVAAILEGADAHPEVWQLGMANSCHCPCSERRIARSHVECKVIYCVRSHVCCVWQDFWWLRTLYFWLSSARTLPRKFQSCTPRFSSERRAPTEHAGVQYGLGVTPCVVRTKWDEAVAFFFRKLAKQALYHHACLVGHLPTLPIWLADFLDFPASSVCRFADGR